MKQLSNPSVWKLAILLIPIPLIMIYEFCTRSNPTWAIIICIISLVAFTIPFTYFCVKQKCYKQLASLSICLITWAIIFYLQVAVIGTD